MITTQLLLLITNQRITNEKKIIQDGLLFPKLSYQPACSVDRLTNIRNS